MADVNFFQAFGYKWALVGPAENLQDDQYKVGWSFIGAVPPSVEQFNRVHQVADEKANYLYGLINSVVVGSGGALTAASVNDLREALTGRNLGGVVITNTGSVAVPALAKRAFVRLWGGGGGGGGMGNAGEGGGGGGGGGGYFEGFLNVTGGASLAAIVGAGGLGGVVGGNNGGFGTSSSFAGLASGAGGSPGQGLTSGSGVGGAGGSATGSGMTIAGMPGQNGVTVGPGLAYLGGSGGGTFGSSISQNPLNSAPSGTFPGGGGAGGGRNNGGGAGGNGLIVIHWLS